eukprot:jgi/Ulvmu1/771/UM010_0145.1
MDRSEEAFGKWAETHGKTYASEEERAKRYKIWQDNVDYIEQQNSKESSYKVCHCNRFSAWHEERHRCMATWPLWMSPCSNIQASCRPRTSDNTGESHINSICESAPLIWLS